MSGGRSIAAQLTDAELVERLQSIAINAAEGQRSVRDDRQYEQLRRAFDKRRLDRPSILATHPTIDSFVAYIKRIEDKRERVKLVRSQFEPLLRQIENRDPVDSAAWTGLQYPKARLRVVRDMLPLAQAAVESLIATLSTPNDNGGPLLDDREEAIVQLRALHGTLGSILTAIDEGHFEDELGQGLAAEAARYAKRAARSLRDDPLPYLSSALLLGLLSACGFPGIGGYVGGIAVNVRKAAVSASKPIHKA